jgi:hypothetical protein
MTVEAGADVFVAGAGIRRSKEKVGEPDKIPINMRFDIPLLGRIDAEAKRIGITRTAWLHLAAHRMLQAATEHHTTGDQPAA